MRVIGFQTLFNWTYIGLLLIIALSSCKAGNQVSRKAEVGKIIKVVSIRKTACFGTCPEYECTIYSNRSAVFKGKNYVPFKGQKEFVLTEDDFVDIKDRLETIGFFDLEDRYFKDVSDLPTTYLYFNNYTQEKMIMNYYGAPEKLREAEIFLEEKIFSYL